MYDLSADLAERDNLAEQQPAVVARIQEFLKTARTESNEWPLGLVQPGFAPPP